MYHATVDIIFAQKLNKPVDFGFHDRQDCVQIGLFAEVDTDSVILRLGTGFGMIRKVVRGVFLKGHPRQEIPLYAPELYSDGWRIEEIDIRARAPCVEMRTVDTGVQ